MSPALQAPAPRLASSTDPAEKMHIDWDGRVTAWATTLLALSTVFVAWFTLRLWRATRTVVESAEMTAKRDLRAYVFVHSARVESLQPTMVPVPRISIKNSGKTPAYNVRVAIDARITHSSVEAVRDPEITSGVGHLAPNGELSLTCRPAEPLGADTFEALIERRSTMVVFGIVRYCDAFSNRHFTRFRLELGTPVVRGANDIVYCEVGNDTDDLT